MNQYAAAGSDKTEQIRRLEQQFDTNVDYGLTSSEARRRLRWSGPHNHETKEKKRLWLRCFMQECHHPLFFFLCILCIFLYCAGEKYWLPTGGVVCLLLFRKGMRTESYRRFLNKRTDLFQAKVLVLRDGMYRKINIHDVVQGDVIRLKKGQQTPVSVCSLCRPGRRYWRGECFAEETGKGIAAENSFSLFNGENAWENYHIYEENAWGLEKMDSGREPFFGRKKRELLFRQKISLRTDVAGVQVICLDEDYFPQKESHRFTDLCKVFMEQNIFLFFFTNREKEEAQRIGQQIGFMEGRRNLVDEKQFECYTEELFQKQIESIQIYSGLSVKEKCEVIFQWKKKGCRILILSRNIAPMKQELDKKAKLRRLADCADIESEGKIFFGMSCEESAKEADVCFLEHWAKGILKLIKAEKIWEHYRNIWEQAEEKIVIFLCVVTACLLIHFMTQKQPEVLRWIYFINSGIIGGILLGQEIFLAAMDWGFPRLLKEKEQNLEIRKNRKREQAVGEAAVAREEWKRK